MPYGWGGWLNFSHKLGFCLRYLICQLWIDFGELVHRFMRVLSFFGGLLYFGFYNKRPPYMGVAYCNDQGSFGKKSDYCPQARDFIHSFVALIHSSVDCGLALSR